MKIICNGQEYDYNITKEKKVLDVLNELKIVSYNPCGGKGTCGKCKIKVKSSGKLPKISTEEETLLTDKEKKDSIRLSCKLEAREDMIVYVNNYKEQGFNILSDFKVKSKKTPIIKSLKIKYERGDLKDQRSIVTKIKKNNSLDYDFSLKALRKLSQNITLSMDSDYKESECTFLIVDEDRVIDIQNHPKIRSYGIAIDIGTTTIVAALVDFESGEVIGIHKSLNSQKSCGADVISRIQYQQQHRNGLLHDLIKNDIKAIVNKICNKYSIEKEHIYHVGISGNTVMIHLLLGLDPYSIAASPFTTTTTAYHVFKYSELFDNEVNCNVSIMPGISAYVGSDILVGLYNCELHKKEKPSIFLDIGTNGEIALGNRDRIMCAATAAGPAFEGANIKNGIGSIGGAIYKVDYPLDQFEYETIQDKPAVGICGTGVVDAISCFLKKHFINSMGILDEKFNSQVEISPKDDIFLYQEDIEQLQFAKSALRAGIELMIKKYGTSYEEIDKIYLAGGFGNNVNLNSLVDIGLIPKKLKDKIELVGNSSLGGTLELLLSEKAIEELDNLKSKMEYIELSKDEGFNDLYIDYMFFEEI